MTTHKFIFVFDKYQRFCETKELLKKFYCKNFIKVFFKVVQLRAKLKSRGLSTSGTKIELIERLNESILVEEKILNSDESGKDITGLLFFFIHFFLEKELSKVDNLLFFWSFFFKMKKQYSTILQALMKMKYSVWQVLWLQ